MYNFNFFMNFLNQIHFNRQINRYIGEDGDISNTVESITLVIIQIAFLLVMMAKEMMLDFSLMNWTVFSLYSVV